MSGVKLPAFPDVITLTVNDAYIALWQKTKAAWQYVYKNHINDYEWYVDVCQLGHRRALALFQQAAAVGSATFQQRSTRAKACVSSKGTICMQKKKFRNSNVLVFLENLKFSQAMNFLNHNTFHCSLSYIVSQSIVYCRHEVWKTQVGGWDQWITAQRAQHIQLRSPCRDPARIFWLHSDMYNLSKGQLARSGSDQQKPLPIQLALWLASALAKK